MIFPKGKENDLKKKKKFYYLWTQESFLDMEFKL